MAQIEVAVPKMGESIVEATILKWLKKEGDRIELDETLLEVATDKVDSEVPSPAQGILVKIIGQVNDVVAIGKTIAIIETEANVSNTAPTASISAPSTTESHTPIVAKIETNKETLSNVQKIPSDRFYSPLVRNIAKQENISTSDLEKIQGTGAQGRLTKRDVIAYIEESGTVSSNIETIVPEKISPTVISEKAPNTAVSISGGSDIIEMDRMRKLISDHMVMSKKVSPHVTSFIEIDVTKLVKWRDKAKGIFEQKYKQKLTFTPIFVEAVAKAIKDFPMINVSVDGSKIIVKKDINVGLAAALPSGNLIVPVIKNADRLNLVGITYQVNELADRARLNKLKPEEIQDGTFTLTNVGTFGNIMGTPIINQPQVAILATGVIQKKPIVIEGPHGDSIGIGRMMFLSLSYDHRVVDGSLGGSFLRRVGDYLEQFDVNQNI